MQYHASVTDHTKCRFYKLFEHIYKGEIGTVEYWRRARPFIEQNMREWKASGKEPRQYFRDKGLWDLLMKLMPIRKKKK
jgi:hypothetical protein